ncbi:MAG: VRR-NUC domain-containing protein [Miniphocaeibacter sp.]|uniref:VRR-NUC domain-containing protein n=1 Tax=Miniphocaeibacter sp. TaxID=3100973 RepID=UPI003BAEF479
MQEKLIEQKLVKEIKKLGGLCPKFVSPGFAGMPDRLVLLPKGKIAFVEVKSKRLNPRPLQVSRHKLLRNLGFKVYVLDDEKEIQIIIQNIIGGDAR